MASSIIKSSAQQLGKLLVEEAKSLYKVKDKIESLQEEMEWMECFLRDADTKQHQERVVQRWVSKIQDLAYEAEDIIARYLSGVSLHRQDGFESTLMWFSHILFNGDAWTLHQLGADIDDLTVNLSELTSKLRTYGIQIISPTKTLEYNALIREARRTSSYTIVDVVGLDDDIRKVVQKLVNAEKIVVGISGIGGLGKTTLARKVFKHKDVRDQFNDNCVWVYISKEFDAESIFQDIFLGLEKENNDKEKSGHENGRDTNEAAQEKGIKTKKERKGPLKGEQLIGGIHNLLQVKRCLIVLDDIWNIDSWDKLKPAFESLRGTSSKILLTSRDKSLLDHFDLPAVMHFSNALNFENSWELFQRKTFSQIGKVGDPSTSGQKKIEISRNEHQDKDQVKNEMEELGKEMVKHCGGLPIAIVALGGILSTKKTISEWKDVQQNLSSYLISDTEQGGSRASRISEVMDLSYHELPYYLKPCFLYLGYFPEDYKISTQKLYQLWEAEGLLVRQGGAKKKGGSMYDIGERYLNELVQRSMVEIEECWEGSGRIKTCRVHDIMRDMCLTKCEEVGFLNHIQCTESDIGVKKLRRCALYDQKGDYIDRHFENEGKAAAGVRSILLFGSEMSSKILTSFPLLRVLALEGVHSYLYIDDVGHLIHLRYLSLRNSQVKRLPSCIYGLKFVETLDLQSKGGLLLQNEFYEMKKLRHLYLPKYFGCGGEKLRFPVEQMETLKNIDPKQCEMTELMQMENLRVFSIIEDYVFSDKDVLKELMESPVMKVSGNLINSFSLRVKADVLNELEPKTISSLAHPCFNELIVLKSAQSRLNLKQGSCMFGDNLTQVDLIEGWMVGGEDVSALEKLQLLKNLTLKTKDKRLSFSAGSFPKLTQLKIHINNLEEWVIGEGALPSLQTLQLINCKNLTSEVNNLPETLKEVVIGHCVIGSGFFATLEQLPCLQKLCLKNPFLRGRQVSMSTTSFPQLIQLSIEFSTSEELEELDFGQGDLPNIQYLTLSYCPKKLKALINLPNSLTQVMIQLTCGMSEGLIVSLGKLPLLQQLQLIDMEELNKLSFPPRSFPSLTRLNIEWASELEEWEVGDGSLPNLKSLMLTWCEKLKRIPDGLPASVHIECEWPCINGIENYNTCPHYYPD